MKKVILPLAAVALVGLYAGTASAQCEWNGGAKPAPARGVKGSMVRAMAACPSTEHPTVNTETEGGTPACGPATPAANNGDQTDYMYGPASKPKGKCDVSTQAKLVKDCSQVEDADGNPLGLQAVPCHVTYVKSKCSGIYRQDGITPINADDAGWSLATLSRVTLDDPVYDDVTVIDFPVTFQYSTPDGGKMEVDSSSAEALIPIVNVNFADLPPCTQIEIVDVTIKDPDENPFARLGGATQPK